MIHERNMNLDTDPPGRGGDLLWWVALTIIFLAAILVAIF
jgi:hypothetical protein